MNWTGGRLQRYSKANANTQLKTQKRSLARARQQCAQASNARPLPSAFSLFKNQRGGRQPRLAPQPLRSVQDPQRLTPRQGDSTAGNIHHPSSGVVISSSPASDRNPLEPKIGTCTEDALCADDRKEPAVDSLGPIKRRLLAIPDWAGLNPTKPVKMNFTPAEEMERFGRRRKSHACRSASTRRLQHCIGSEIHQTQTSLESLPQRTRLSVAPSHSSESMLLDKFDAKVQKKGEPMTDSRLLIHFEHHRDDHESAQNLVPLDEVRDLKSWDEVLERSSSRSLVVAKARSSTPFMEPNDAAASVAAASNFVLPPLRKSGVASETILRSIKNKTDATEASVGECAASMTSEVGDKESYEPPVRTASRRPPYFTLEKQVAMEQEFLRNINYSTHQQADMPPSLAMRPCPLAPDADIGLTHSGSTTDQFGLSDVHLNSSLSAVDDSTCHNLSQRLARGNKCNGISNRLADENDAWMKSVFPKDFERIQNSFSFHKPLRTWKTQQSNCSSEPFCLVKGGPAMDQRFTPDSYHTDPSQNIRPPNADSTIFDRTWQSNRNQLESTPNDATSILPRFSPMIGTFTKELGSISTMNDRIFVPQNDEISIRETYNRHSPLKRTAEQAFPDASSSHYHRRLPLQPTNPSPSIAESTTGLGTAQGLVINNIDLLQQTPTQSFISVPGSAAPEVGHGLLLSERSPPPVCGSLFNDFRMLHTPC